MKLVRSIFIYLAVVTLLLGGVATSYATNGYFANGYSVKNKALAGAGTALPLDSLAAATNPAGMVWVGKRVDVGLSLFNPNREYTATPSATGNVKPENIESDSEWFVIPSLGFNWMMNDNYSLGVSIYGNGGMNTDYDTTTYLSGMSPASSPTGVDLMQLFIVPTYARKLVPKHSIGLSPVFAFQRFEAKGLEPFLGLSTAFPTNKLTNQDHDNSYGFGGRIGYLGEIMPGLFLGASYQTKIYMSEYDDYEGLFAEQGDFDIPASWSAGFAYHLSEPALTFAVDVQQIFYSDVDSIGNSFNPAFNSCFGAVSMGSSPDTVSHCLGGDDGVGFGWDDITIVKIGVEWQSGPEWTWRAGYSYGEQPIPNDEVLFNIIAPGVIEHHATAGFTKTIGSNQELSVAVMHAFSNEVKGKNPLDIADVQTIELKMNQWEYTAGYSWKF